MTSRNIRQSETDLLKRILKADQSLEGHLGRLAEYRVAEIDKYGSLALELPGADSPGGSPMHKLPAEGQAEDADGVFVHFLVFERNGSLCELQVYKEDGTRVIRPPSLMDIEVLVLK